MVGETLDQWASAAGYYTRKALAESAGLADYEISRIANGQRRPTGPQLRKLAVALKRPRAEVAALLLPEGEFELEALADVTSERDKLVADLGVVRGELVETKAKLEQAQAQIKILGAELSRFQQEKDRLVEDIGQHRAQATAAAERNRFLVREKSTLEEENRRLQRLVDETQTVLETVKRETTNDLWKLHSELQEARDELGRERAAGLQRQILTGTLGAAVGAIVRGAAANRRPRRDEDDSDCDE
ncbi:MAG: helix-turn-helix domain-containing protein [Enhygromyxa sp.]